ncbi:exosortase A [Aquincola sp. MAHUQ-54]|uniref:Exosortase A n=1 Tax=Aquincola agrisoli TaxID=3119538 RepID=A0AAW9QCC3_9BURK
MTGLVSSAAMDPTHAAQWRRSGLALALLLACIGVFFFDTFRSMEQIWSRSETFAHAYVVPPIGLWLIWRQRTALARQMPAPTVWLLAPFLLLCATWLVGQLAAVNAVTQLSATGLVVLSVPLVLGWHTAKVILFPLAFLFFAVPIGEFMIPPLMHATADFTVLALRLSGIPVYREGLQFVIPSGNWSVVEACSGVRYLMASFMVGSLFAYLNYRSWQRRTVFALVSLAVPIVANWVRAYMIVMLGHLSSNQLAVGADHLLYGWVFFGVVVTAVFMLGARWSEAPAGPQHALPPSDVAARPGWHLWCATALAIAAAATPQQALNRIDDPATTAGPPQLSLPAELQGGWRVDASGDSAWKPAFRNPDAEASRRYVHAGVPPVGAYLAYYRQQSEGRKLASAENQVVSLQDRNWNPVDTATHTVALEDGRELKVLQTTLLRTDSSHLVDRRSMLVWQFYWLGGPVTSSDHVAKAIGAWQRLRGEGDDGAAVMLYAEDTTGQATAAAALHDFLRANWGLIEQGLTRTRATR